MPSGQYNVFELSTGSVVSLTTTGASVVSLTSSSAIPMSTVGTITVVGLTDSTTQQVILAANANRKKALIQNGAAASAAFYTIASTSVISSTSMGGFNLTLAAGASYDLSGSVIFTGGITGVAGLATGSTTIVTEFT